ncbi:hypothetical protein QTP88_022921 [Uroleucon formosanum]
MCVWDEYVANAAVIYIRNNYRSELRTPLMPFCYNPALYSTATSTASYYYVRPHFTPSERPNDRFPAQTTGHAVRVSDGRHGGPLDLNDCDTYLDCYTQYCTTNYYFGFSKYNMKRFPKYPHIYLQSWITYNLLYYFDLHKHLPRLLTLCKHLDYHNMYNGTLRIAAPNTLWESLAQTVCTSSWCSTIVVVASCFGNGIVTTTRVLIHYVILRGEE